MLRKKPSVAFSPVSSQTSSSRSHSPAPADWDADDEDGAMSGDDAFSVRPTPLTMPSDPHLHTCGAKRPSLKEILANTSSPPWTLTAFMAYLSNNHCLETLEFTMDAARYRKHYAKIIAKSDGPPQGPDAANIKVLWSRLIEAYIRPNGSREINIPSEVRDPILSYDFSELPPPPEILDVAVTKVYELMEESVLVPFLNSMSPPASSSPPNSGCGCDSPDEPDAGSAREDWFKFRKSMFGKTSPPVVSPSDSPPFPPLSSRKSNPTSLSNALHRHRLSNRISPPNSANHSTISHSGDTNILPSLTDDSGYNSAHTNDSLMTPPMGPMDDELGTSPRSKDGGWKKFGRLSQWKPKQKKSQPSFSETAP